MRRLNPRDGLTDITMATSGGTVKAQPSALNGSGDGFSDTWHHS
ncbi:MAG TPA: hypothetical protein VFS83_17175 [Ktedonobacterales bacterium]|nr:hypothetical protein [Ktedonobacterales bacterium]